MGFSLQHSSEVPQVLNLSTGRITTQFHFIFDDQFSTLASIERESEPMSHREELGLDNSLQVTIDDPSHYLDSNWMTDEERKCKGCDLQRKTTIREATNDVHLT
jgi:hypothetical protein